MIYDLLLVTAFAVGDGGQPEAQPAPATAEPPLPVFHAQFPTRMPMPVRTREFVPPETVGVEKDCPLATVKKAVCFECPKCGLKSKTHVLYHHLPWCPKDKWVMNEIEKW